MSERRTVTSAPRSEEHTSELQSQSNLVCRIIRSEEHTSELQSQSNLVCRLLLEKKKKYHFDVHSHIRLRHGPQTCLSSCSCTCAHKSPPQRAVASLASTSLTSATYTDHPTPQNLAQTTRPRTPNPSATPILFFFLMIRRPPRSRLYPSTTLFFFYRKSTPLNSSHCQISYAVS